MRAEIIKRLTSLETGWNGVRELRLRAGRPILAQTGDGERVLLEDGSMEPWTEAASSHLPVLADRAMLKEILEVFSRHSLYAFEEEISRGFLTIRGGHRVGICGKAVFDDQGIRTIREISGLNIRIAHEIKGCADRVLPWLFQDGLFQDTLIVSPPGSGKTTLLRDLIRRLSDGGAMGPGKNVSVVDERSEIAACFQGVPQCDLGMRTDVMDGCPKAFGLMMMVRSMSPQVIAVDEIGAREDLEAMRYGVNCGCQILATVHGTSVEEIKRKPVLAKLVRDGIFSRYVVLTGKPRPGTVTGIYDRAFYPVFIPEEVRG